MLSSLAPALSILLSSFALAACGRGDVVSERPAIDARPVHAVAAYAPLVGHWSGSASVPGVGLATGVVTVDASGAGPFFVSLSGVSRSGRLQILRLQDGLVRGRALGMEREVPIRIEANRLRLRVPAVGEVVLVRER